MLWPTIAEWNKQVWCILVISYFWPAHLWMSVGKSLILPIYVLCLFVLFFRATPMAYGSSQARGWIGATAAEPTPQPQHYQIRAVSLTYTTAHGNARSLTHWAGPGIEPASSWILVRFTSTVPQQELPPYIFFSLILYLCLFTISLSILQNAAQ